MKLVSKSPNLFPNLWNDFFYNTKPLSESDIFLAPPTNITENFSKFAIDIVAAGFDKKDFEIDVDDYVLTVNAQPTVVSKNDEETKYRLQEFTANSFTRRFTLPDTVNLQKIEASYNNGILRIEIPKRKEAQGIKKMVEIS